MSQSHFPRKKRFTEERTKEKRLSDRWDQQVFFLKSKSPHLAAEISAIVRRHEAKHGSPFTPSESALDDLDALK